MADFVPLICSNMKTMIQNISNVRTINLPFSLSQRDIRIFISGRIISRARSLCESRPHSLGSRLAEAVGSYDPGNEGGKRLRCSVVWNLLVKSRNALLIWSSPSPITGAISARSILFSQA